MVKQNTEYNGIYLLFLLELLISRFLKWRKKIGRWIFFTNEFSSGEFWSGHSFEIATKIHFSSRPKYIHVIVFWLRHRDSYKYFSYQILATSFSPSRTLWSKLIFNRDQNTFCTTTRIHRSKSNFGRVTEIHIWVRPKYIFRNVFWSHDPNWFSIAWIRISWTKYSLRTSFGH